MQLQASYVTHCFVRETRGGVFTGWLSSPAPDYYHLYLYPILSISLLPSQTSRDEEKGEELSYQKGEELSYQRREG